MGELDARSTLRAETRVQVETELDTNLLTGQIIVRVKYRPEGVRRWTKLVVIPDDDQDAQKLLREGHLIAQAHMDYRRAA